LLVWKRQKLFLLNFHKHEKLVKKECEYILYSYSFYYQQ
jgi:hypothetical protein